MHRLVGSLVHIADHLFDLLGRLLGAMGQRTHLVGHYRKTTTRIPCPRRLDGRIERQQVGLLGDRANHIQDLADIADLTRQALHFGSRLRDVVCQQADRLHRADDLLAAMLCRIIGLARRFGGRHGVARHLVHRGGHLVDRRCSLLDLVILLVEAAGGVFGHDVEFLSRRSQLAGGVSNALNRFAQACLHAPQRSQQASGLVTPDHLNATRQIARSNDLGNTYSLV